MPIGKEGRGERRRKSRGKEKREERKGKGRNGKGRGRIMAVGGWTALGYDMRCAVRCFSKRGLGHNPSSMIGFD